MAVRFGTLTLSALLVLATPWCCTRAGEPETPPAPGPEAGSGKDSGSNAQDANSDGEIDPDVLRKVRRLIRDTLSEEAEDRDKAIAALKDMGNLATPGLIAVARLPETTAPMKLAIIDALADTKDKRAGALLKELLAAPERAVKERAARAAGDCGAVDALPELEKLAATATEAPMTRVYAASAGVRLGSAAARTQLEALTRVEQPDVRSRAVFFLGKFGGASAAETLTAALKDPETSVREDAIEGLRLVGDPAGTKGLIAALDDSDYKLRRAAMDALASITKEKFGTDAAAWKDWFAKRPPPKPAEPPKDKTEALKE